MNLSFVLMALVGMTFLGLVLGTAVKMWFYGVRDLMLLMSPLLVITFVIGFPLFTLNVVLFHPEQIDRRRVSESGNKILLADMKPAKRFLTGVILIVRLTEHYPMLVGTFSYIAAAALEGRKVSRKKRDEMVSAVLDLALAYA